MDGTLISCRHCEIEFCVCSSCWKCQRYCSSDCRKKARRQSHCKDQKKYADTQMGKAGQRQRNRRYLNKKKIVTDQTTTEQEVDLFPSQGTGVCVYCRKVVTRLRGFSTPYFSFRRREDDS